MAAYRLTSKGQVTIPKAMRDAIGLRPGDVVEFERDGERLFISRARYERAEDHPLIKRMREAGERMTMSSEELMKLLRDPDDVL